MDINSLLKLLADGRFHSGEELGEVLGVSRTAVWKHLRKLEPLGLVLTSVKGRGYCLEGGLELLDADAIDAALNPAARALAVELDIQSVIDSTNTRALARAAAGNARGYICLAEQQTAGKGRRGRAWVSPFGRNIYLSVVWGFDGGAAVLEGLSLAVSVAVTRALRDLAATAGDAGTRLDDIRLKWPNDVLWRGRKLAGILLEMTGDVSSFCQVVSGIGINVTMPAVAGAAIDQAWVDMETIVGRCSRNQLVAQLLNHLLPLLDDFQARGFACLREEWESLDAYRNCQVELRTATESVLGAACGVTETGGLRILVDGREQVFSGGEISLRPTA
ncbi:bifunctional biotin--[acetyl-CoA-carboxylase] ligase/biotin operon repressor BirA [Exilibacterium tricleocarpae]|uniref:Bifunctional ligase/repressor BirA n=1 Tax=Exilibacterium tricleocarpae TaxID=2591008 RepID=A0A545SQP6_9GAMM|nr:bifunctional biotin--[acetyl-CoA-carboxylase] ligase/biotin operon repressor BirA [Exilibacterium tricleocarpae]TQV67294.1 bifunctional biotin--[acetyl-CoA-carboxylase] ligase/biotin operon repressor BirA [Exilibacterium tricleocarpae]